MGHTGEIYPAGFLPLLCGRFPQDSVVDVYQHHPRSSCSAIRSNSRASAASANTAASVAAAEPGRMRSPATQWAPSRTALSPRNLNCCCSRHAPATIILPFVFR